MKNSKTIYLKGISRGPLGDEEPSPVYARFDDGLPSNCPPLAPGVEIVESAPSWYEGFLISGFDWKSFFSK